MNSHPRTPHRDAGSAPRPTDGTPATKRPPRGFALIATLSMMILLTLVAVGLLSLSSISLRTASNGSAMATAQSNARLALMLAIGELQKAAGPDTRITAPANLVNADAPAGVTGVWNSWKPNPPDEIDYAGARSASNFQGYLLSNPQPQSAADPAQLPSSSSGTKQLVGPGTIGPDSVGQEILAPSIPLMATRRDTPTGHIAWATLDEGVKSRIDLTPEEEATTRGERITRLGSPARNGFESIPDMPFLNGNNDDLKLTLPKLVSLNEATLESSGEAVARRFHDFTVSSHSVQADVVKGGLKTDLSVLFDGNYSATLPSDYANRFLYSDTTTPFENSTSDVQWGIFANYMRLYRRTNANDNPLAGLRATLPPGYALRQIVDQTARKPRFEPNLTSASTSATAPKIKHPVLMPTVLRVDTVFSLIVRDAHGPWTHGTYNYLLHLLYLPVITLHNPYNVPLRVTGLQVEFADVPVGFEFLINNQPATSGGLTNLNNFYVSAGGGRKAFSLTLSNSLNSNTEVLMGPGETRIFGTPFPSDLSWQAELASNGSRASGARFFDWQNTLTTDVRVTPGVITGPNDGVGFDVDWLAPSQRTQSHISRAGDRGVINVRMNDDIKVRFGPKSPSSASGTFAMTVRLNNAVAGETRVFYLNDSRLKTVVEEGTSPRFTESRSFPVVFPGPGSSPLSGSSLYEPNATRLRDYTRARPFAIFSVGAKTTTESFTASRPFADTGAAFQMATCDFTTSTSQGINPLEFALVPVKNGSAAMEAGGPNNNQAYFFGGHGVLNGTTAATLYEIPMAPVQSIAQLRHANGSSLGSIPYVTYSVGESRAHPAIPASSIFTKPDGSKTWLDHSWLANDRLWDSYWLSTLSTLQGVAYTGPSALSQTELARRFFGSDPATRTSLPNPRNIPLLPAGMSTEDAIAAATAPDGTQSAAMILTKGGFNVNSTSVPAWISVLSGLARADVPLASGATDSNPPGVPFSRVRQPSGPLNGSLTMREQLWNSYRTLEKEEIEKLAELIVEEIRERGPFLSMSDFVNRRIGSAGPLSASGAIQAAIERSGINGIMESNATPIESSATSAYGWANPSAVRGNSGAGSPGEVSQGDVLSVIGSFINVRSDTFRIRAYGDARDPSGKVIATAWCEAILQRVPDYVDPTDAAHITATSTINQTFGRRFQVVDFRWLRQSEI
jgi:hypothetical protein